MTKFAYVILHYKNMKDTIECIDSIKKQSKSPLIIVDNGTLSSEQYQQLSKYTKDILLLEENLGFAKANNMGVSYAMKKYKADFVVVINNDILITQANFEKKIIDTYQKTSFDMLGPKIVTDQGDSVNPFPVYKNVEEVCQAIRRTKRNISIFSSRLKTAFFQIYHMIKYKFKKPVHLKNGEQLMTNVALHGCAIIFSKKYLEKYNNAFYPDTFLYHEEEFLYYRVQKNHLISCYNPDIYCFHKEGSSLNKQFKDQNRKKELFRNQKILDSLEKLLEIMKKNCDI